MELRMRMDFGDWMKDVVNEIVKQQNTIIQYQRLLEENGISFNDCNSDFTMFWMGSEILKGYLIDIANRTTEIKDKPIIDALIGIGVLKNIEENT